MEPIRTEYVMTVSLSVTEPIADLGDVPWGRRRIAKVAGGRFEGPRSRASCMAAAATG